MCYQQQRISFTDRQRQRERDVARERQRERAPFLAAPCHLYSATVPSILISTACPDQAASNSANVTVL